jgi:O-antigen biosynthesis protein
VQPLVTCLCLTTDARREWLPKALECFRRQTYPNLELVIVYTGEHFVPEGLDACPSVNARVIHSNGTIGYKRNVGCEFAHGELIAHWDDDDWSHIERISSQVAFLRSSGKSVTGYHSMKFTDGASWWQYVGSQGYALGTSLLYRREWWSDHSFDDSLNCGEDMAFVTPALRQRQFLSEPDGNLMYATIHPGNTSKRGVKRESCWKPLPGFQWRVA